MGREDEVQRENPRATLVKNVEALITRIKSNAGIIPQGGEAAATTVWNNLIDGNNRSLQAEVKNIFDDFDGNLQSANDQLLQIDNFAKKLSETNPQSGDLKNLTEQVQQSQQFIAGLRDVLPSLSIAGVETCISSLETVNDHLNQLITKIKNLLSRTQDESQRRIINAMDRTADGINGPQAQIQRLLDLQNDLKTLAIMKDQSKALAELKEKLPSMIGSSAQVQKSSEATAESAPVAQN